MRLWIPVLSLTIMVSVLGYASSEHKTLERGQSDHVSDSASAPPRGARVSTEKSLELLASFLQLDRQARVPGLDNSALTGTYASTDAGGINATFPNSQVGASLGLWRFDGRGNVTRMRVARLTGFGLESSTRSGTYVVNPNGSLTVQFETGMLEGYVVANGDGFFYANLRITGETEAGYGRKM